MDKQMCYIHTMEYYLAIKKEWSTDSHSHMSELAMLSGKSQIRKFIYCMINLYEISKIGQFIETEGRLVDTRV